MSDYSKLVKALRCKRDDCEGCDLAFFDKDEGWMCRYAAKDDDAADAIVALGLDNEDYEHENRRLHGEIEALQAQLPKRGKIVRCGECRYRITAHGIYDGWVLCTKPSTERGNAMHRADWFCADGERKVQE